MEPLAPPQDGAVPCLRVSEKEPLRDVRRPHDGHGCEPDRPQGGQPVEGARRPRRPEAHGGDVPVCHGRPLVEWGTRGITFISDLLLETSSYTHAPWNIIIHTPRRPLWRRHSHAWSTRTTSQPSNMTLTYCHHPSLCRSMTIRLCPQRRSHIMTTWSCHVEWRVLTVVVVLHISTKNNDNNIMINLTLMILTRPSPWMGAFLLSW